MDVKVRIAYPAADAAARVVADAVVEALADAAVTSEVAPLGSTVTDFADPESAEPETANAAERAEWVVLALPVGGAPASVPSRLAGTRATAVLGVTAKPLDTVCRTTARAALVHELAPLSWLEPAAVEVVSSALWPERCHAAQPVPELDLVDWETIRGWVHTLPGRMGLPVPVG